MRTHHLIAIAGAIAAAAWILSGQTDDSGIGDPDWARTAYQPPSVASSGEEAPAATAVRTKTSTARARVRKVMVRGRTAVNRAVTVMAETAGRVTRVEVARGAEVAAGDVLVRLALDERNARLAEARAILRQREIEFQAAMRLSAKGFRAVTKTAEAAALLDRAKAALKTIEVDIAHTVIRAPFAGVVELRQAELGAFIDRGKPVARIVDRSPLLVVGQVTEREVGLIARGQPAMARLVTGDVVEGRVRFVATVADPATRTFRIEIEVANADRRLVAGITAEISIPIETLTAHLVSPAMLTLDDDGVIGVKSVAEDSIVAFLPVEILGEEPDGVWLTGLPETVTLITIGQEFVRDGETVRVTPTEDRPRS